MKCFVAEKFGSTEPCMFSCTRICRRFAYSKKRGAGQEEAAVEGDFLLEGGGPLLAE